MKVKYSKSTQEDFRKHRDYLTRTGKSDGHKYQKYELDGISKSYNYLNYISDSAKKSIALL